MPVALVALGAIPVIAGALRLVQLAGGPAIMPAGRTGSPRRPLPLVVHIVGATVFALLGYPCSSCPGSAAGTRLAPRAGRVLVVAGLGVALSALWLTLFYEAQPGTGDLLYGLRLVFGCRDGRLPRARGRRGPSRRHRAPTGRG